MGILALDAAPTIHQLYMAILVSWSLWWFTNQPFRIWVVLCSGSNTFPTNQMYIAPKLTWVASDGNQKDKIWCLFLCFYPWKCHFFLCPRLRRGTLWPSITYMDTDIKDTWPKPTNQMYMEAAPPLSSNKSNLPMRMWLFAGRFSVGANFPTKET